MARSFSSKYLIKTFFFYLVLNIRLLVMNKYLRDVVPGIILVAWAIVLEGAEACSSFHNAFEGHYAGVVDLSATCFQSLDGNHSGLVSFLRADLRKRF